MSTWLLWCDLETTGLSVTRDELLEAAFILTDPDLNELGTVHAVIQPGPFGLKRLMDTPVVRKIHTDNGLIVDVIQGPGCDAVTVESQVLTLLDQHATKGDIIHLAGSGIAAFDRPLLNEYMPTLTSRLHYAPIDIGVLRRTWRMWTGRDITEDNAAKTHRAMDDVEGHLREARAFRKAFTGGLTPTELEADRNAALGRAEIQVNPELITDFDEVEIAPGMTVAAPRPNHHPACTTKETQ